MADIKFTEDHEWIRVDGDIGTVGITDFAQEQLGDIVFIELPETGTILRKGDQAGVIESVKAASEIYSPVGGDVVETNNLLTDAPEAVNGDAQGAGWIFKIKFLEISELNCLMDEDTYKKFIS